MSAHQVTKVGSLAAPRAQGRACQPGGIRINLQAEIFAACDQYGSVSAPTSPPTKAGNRTSSRGTPGHAEGITP